MKSKRKRFDAGPARLRRSPCGHGADASGRAGQLCRGNQSADSKDTEKLTTRYPRVTKQIQDKGASPKLLAVECRIAWQLGPCLEEQLAAMRQSGCGKDPQMGNMIADIVRGHEGDLAMVRKTAARSECR